MKKFNFPACLNFLKHYFPQNFHLPFGKVEGKIHYPGAIGHQPLCTLFILGSSDQCSCSREKRGGVESRGTEKEESH